MIGFLCAETVVYSVREIDRISEEAIRRMADLTVTGETIQSVEDLEKLFFVWQEATEVADTDKEITVGKELESSETRYRILRTYCHG